MPSEALLPIGAELRRLREERGLSLRGVAQLTALDWSRLREWERGIDNHTGRAVVPPVRALRKLARVYEVPPDDLLRLAGHGPGPELPSDEQQLLSGYRALPESQRPKLLQALAQLQAEAPNEA